MNDSDGLNDLQEVFWIDDGETMELLADPVRLEIIELLSRPQSVTELAEAMGVPRTRLYHHMNLMTEAGFITVVDTRQSGAVAEKIYSVAAKSYQPSPTYLASADPREQAEAMLTAIFGSTRADFIRAADEGLVHLDQEKESRSMFIRRSLSRLRPDDLHSLVTELGELLERYDDKDDPDGISVGILALVHPSSRRQQ